MTYAQDVNTAQSSAETAQVIAKKLNKMSKTATTLAKEGKTLSTVDTLLADVKFFGRAGTVLGAVGAGLGVVSLILGEKSAAEQNTELLGAMKGQISQLSADMKRLFADQTRERHLIAATQRWDEHFDYLALCHSRYDLYVANPSTSYRNDLLKLDPMEMMRQADEFGKLMEDPRAQENLLEATYESSFGNEGTILTIGTHVLAEIYFLQNLCMVLRDLIASHEPTRLEDIPLEADISKRFAQAIGIIADQIGYYAQLCQTHVWKNVDECLTNRVFTNITLDWNGYFTKNSKDIGEALQAQWPRFDWSVIVYDAVRGFNRHGVSSRGIWRKDYFGEGGDESTYGQACKLGRANIIVAAVSVGAPIYDAANENDLNEAWYDLTLDARATMVIQNSLQGFQNRKRNGLFFYCKKEGSADGVRVDFWSRAQGHSERDTRRQISVRNQGTSEEGRILWSNINLAYVDKHNRHHASDNYYQLAHLTA
jgi:hypothetical protein